MPAADLDQIRATINRPCRLHLVGIGGTGMAPMAEILARRGCQVTGTDLRDSPVTQGLRDKGIKVEVGHHPLLVHGADAVVRSSAIPDQDPEVLEARRAGLPIFKRAEVLGALTELHRTVAIAGTHGKTTTTALTGLALSAAGADPTIMAGGEIPELGSGARVGESDLLVVEADEFDHSFLNFSPAIAVVTNVQPDHLDYFGDADSVDAAFAAFLDRVARDGVVVYCRDDPVATVLAPRAGRQAVSYGTDTGAENRVLARRPLTGGAQDVEYALRDERLGLRLQSPGQHYALNALAALSVCSLLGADLSMAGEALERFNGVRRRLELIGSYNDIAVYDDYAHHPTEIAATLAGAREMAEGRIIAVFQPHLYSRTRSLFDDFLDKFRLADQVLIADTYSPAGRDTPDPSFGSERLAAAVRHDTVRYSGGLKATETLLAQVAQPGDTIVVMGAGNVTDLAHRLPMVLEGVVNG